MKIELNNLTEAVKRKKVAFSSKLLDWTNCNQRKYPWRAEGKSPFQILVAELLLKRTTASAAAKIYTSFLKKYPTLLELSEASEQELAQNLRHVGLYRQRARDITKLSQYLIQEENGIVPCLLNKLLNAPGLGEYSARAILSFGCGVPVAVVDSNVERVITRVFHNVFTVKPSLNVLQRIADELLEKDAHQRFNFGLLDLGATICRYSLPLHNDCPLVEICDFFTWSQEESLPVNPIHSLRRIRQEKGFTLAELARRATVSKLTIVKIEAGRTEPQPLTIKKIADALGIQPDELIVPQD